MFHISNYFPQFKDLQIFYIQNFDSYSDFKSQFNTEGIFFFFVFQLACGHPQIIQGHY